MENNMKAHDKVTGLYYGNYPAGPLIAKQCIIVDSDNKSIIVSPGTNFESQEVQDIIDQYPIKAIIAPNSYHNMGVKFVQNRFDVPCYAAKSGLDRLSKFPIKNLTNIEQLAVKRNDFSVFIPDGQKMGESWITLGEDTYRSLIVTDAFFNLKALHKNFFISIFNRLADNAPGFKVSRLFSLIAITDKTLYSKSVREYFKQNHFDEMIVAHGSIQVSDVNTLVDRSLKERGL